jgi:hypothetical protein
MNALILRKGKSANRATLSDEPHSGRNRGLAFNGRSLWFSLRRFLLIGLTSAGHASRSIVCQIGNERFDIHWVIEDLPPPAYRNRKRLK